MNLKLCLSTITLILSFPIFSQISTDRPDQTEGTFVLEKGNAQIESGWTFDTDTLVLQNQILWTGTRLGTEINWQASPK